MIDIENDIFDYVKKAVKSAHSGVDVSTEYLELPAKLPHVSVIEADNRVLTRMRTNNIENAASVMYEVNIYSNKAAVKKSEAKEIANTLDDAMSEIGFTRTFREQIPNMRDANIYRIVCRYEAEIDKNFVIYQSE